MNRLKYLANPMSPPVYHTPGSVKSVSMPAPGTQTIATIIRTSCIFISSDELAFRSQAPKVLELGFNFRSHYPTCYRAHVLDKAGSEDNDIGFDLCAILKHKPVRRILCGNASGLDFDLCVIRQWESHIKREIHDLPIPD